MAQFRAALENDDIVVADAIVSAIDTDGAEGVSDADIAAYLSADADEARTRLRNALRWGFSDAEKAVLQAVATGDGAGPTAALEDADAGFSMAYKDAVRALLDR